MLRRFLIFLFALAMASLVLIWLLLQGSLPAYEGKHPLAGLHGTVAAERDALGSVTLRAGNRSDLARSLGFIHAQERFFEMDLLRRQAAGELAELFGAAALPADRRNRAHRMRARVHAMLAELPDDQRDLLAAYRDGVNQGLDGLQIRPFGYLLTQTTPHPWRSEDSLLVVVAMYMTLQEASIDRELGLSVMHAALPESAYRFLVASGGEWDAPLNGKTLKWPPYPAMTDIDLRTLDPHLFQDMDFEEVPAAGSNSFAVAGELATDGALVANDLHLPLRAPSLWFRTRLIYPDPTQPHQTIDINGVSLPGTPAIVVGANRHIAWSFTNAYGDFADWVRITLDPADASRYYNHGQWKTISTQRETLRVNGAPDETLEIHETEWGPILARDHDGAPLALAWAAHRPGAVNLDLIELERTTSAGEAATIAQKAGIPAQNFIVGDRKGNIAWTVGGRIPARMGDYDFGLPANWGRQPIGWNGWLDHTHYPLIKNPPGMRLWNGNSRMIDGDLLDRLGDGGYELGARSKQIRDQLHARDHFLPTDLLAIQLDSRALLLTRWKHLLEQTLQNTPSTAAWRVEIEQALRDWDGQASPHSVAYRVVRDFRHEVMGRALSGFTAMVKLKFPDFILPRLSQAEHAVWKLIEQQPPHLLPPGNDNWNGLLAACAKHIAKQMQTQPGGIAARSWGEQNTAEIRHPLSRALPAWIAKWLDMPADPLPGDHHMPRVQVKSFGASLRFVVTPGKEESGFFHMPGGQSGHPLSPYYGSGHHDWVTGNSSAFLPGPPERILQLYPPSMIPHP